MNARLTHKRALLHNATGPIDALGTLKPASMPQQPIEAAVFLENLATLHCP
jgi:hypothetical protein